MEAANVECSRNTMSDVKDGRVVKGINFVDLIDAGDQ
ncbi:MAG: hypothetical protein CM15mP62_03950 [Rhodospirillaceae bacterium]|nr:MAG: hypothetical protein CM15mP62_03950 [Rhodospirillaceae bacterium]